MNPILAREPGVAVIGVSNAWMHGKSLAFVPLGHFQRILGFFDMKCDGAHACDLKKAGVDALHTARFAGMRLYRSRAQAAREDSSGLMRRPNGGHKITPLFRFADNLSGRVKKYKKSAKAS